MLRITIIVPLKLVLFYTLYLYILEDKKDICHAIH